jgi:hypothetical protein
MLSELNFRPPKQFEVEVKFFTAGRKSEMRGFLSFDRLRIRMTD